MTARTDVKNLNELGQDGLIVWAVSPYPEHRVLQLQMAQKLEAICLGLPAKIEPVCLLDSHDLEIARHLTGKTREEVRSELEKGVRGWLATSGIRELGEPVFLVDEHFSIKSKVQVLMSHATQRKAHTIAASTHARSGLPRFFLGSFSETLAFRSALPTLLINPHSRSQARVNEILYPSELKAGTSETFAAVAGLAARMGARIILFHQLHHPMEFFMPPAPPSAYAGFVDAEVKFRKKEAEAWIRIAEAQGVRAELVIDSKGLAIPESILQCASQLSSPLIVLPTHGGPVVNTFLGSVARRVLREADCPVWILPGSP